METGSVVLNRNPQARNLFENIGYLQKREGLHFEIHVVR